jgi:hypothetical protein
LRKSGGYCDRSGEKAAAGWAILGHGCSWSE